MNGFDYKEALQFAEGLKTAEKDITDFLESFLLMLASRALTKVSKAKKSGQHGTPVDTGWLRKNWKLTDVKVKGGAFEVTLYNPVDYAGYVENGHRYKKKDGTWGYKEPVYMAKLSIQEIEEEMPIRFQRQFKTFLKERGVL